MGVIEMQKELIKSLKGQVKEQSEIIKLLSRSKNETIYSYGQIINN